MINNQTSSDLEKIAQKDKTTNSVRAALIGGILVGASLVGIFYDTLKSVFTSQDPTPIVQPSNSSVKQANSEDLGQRTVDLTTQFERIEGKKEFYQFDGAKHTLVHIKQVGYHPEMINLSLEEKIDLYKNMIQLHKEIRDTVRSLAKLGYQDVYLEGFTFEDIQRRTNRSLEEIEKTTSPFIEAYFRTPNDAGITNSVSVELVSSLNDIPTSHIHESASGLYTIHPAEIKHLSRSRYHSLITPTNRRDIVLQIVAINNAPNNIVIYNGADNLVDSISSWNSDKRNIPFNLVVITHDGSYK